MKQYRVKLQRTTREIAYVIVDAEDMSDAHEKAKDAAFESQLEWDEDSNSSDVEVLESEELDRDNEPEDT